MDMHQACQGTDAGSVAGAAERVAVSAWQPGEAGSPAAHGAGSGEPGKEPACRARQAATPLTGRLEGWPENTQNDLIPC